MAFLPEIHLGHARMRHAHATHYNHATLTQTLLPYCIMARTLARFALARIHCVPDEPSPVNLSIHLIKDSDEDITSALSNPARLQRHAVRIHEGQGQLFITRSNARLPEWASFFSPQIDYRSFGMTKSVSAVLLLEAGGRSFALTFGPGGRFLLDKTKIEERFGLFVVLNSIPENRFRSMDKTAFDALATHSRVQTSREASPAEFGLDVERDLVRAVTGSPDGADLGQRLHGVDSLGAAVRIELNDLPGLLRTYLDRYLSTSYKTSFPWIDHIAEVKDSVLRRSLDEKLVALIQRRQSETCWLAVPEIVDWDRIHRFRYGGGQRNPTHHDVDLEAWLNELISNTKHLLSSADVDLRLLSNRKILALDADGRDVAQWPIYKCLNAELEGDDDCAYLISAGKWYRVARDFVQSVNENYRRIPRFDQDMPEYRHENEGSYNESVARYDPGTFALLDKQNIPYGGGPNRIEFCDLYTKSRDIIHVKRYGGSNVLSHLFSQGTVPGELFWTQPDFRESVNQRLPESHRIDDHTRQPSPHEYQVVFAVVSNQVGKDLSLPFFSRLNLRAAARRLQGYGYRVSIAKIPVQQEFAVTKIYDQVAR